MDKFHYLSYAQEVVFGPGSLGQIGQASDRFDRRRFMLCASRSVRSNGYVAALAAALGERLVAVFDGVRPHVQDVQVEAALTLAVDNDVEAVIGMGGGSPIGMAKAVAHALDKKRSDQARQATPPDGHPGIPIIAIPTTYAGSEMTAVYGVTHTDVDPPRKVTVSDAQVCPRLVVYDPQLTLDLPQALTASTGINALAHCIEALYSVTRHPLSSAAAVSGVRYIYNSLLRCYARGKDVEARTEMLVGAHLAGLSLASVSMGLHHGLCHVLGGTAGVPHGIANSILLPHAVRFNAEAGAAQLLPAAEAMGISVDGHSPAAAAELLAQKISALAGQMNLPQRLRDAGVKKSDLPALAGLAFQNRTVQNNPRPIKEATQLEQLLRDAW